jgi:hypothetical protein
MKRLIFVGVVTMMLASSSFIACGGGSCLDEYPCNVPADDPDASFDGGSTKGDAGLNDASIDVVSDASDLDSAASDASGETDGGDAADD